MNQQVKPASTNRKTVEGLEPQPVWQIFADLANVPRPSKEEGRIREFILQFAADHGLDARTDGIGNVTLAAPASAGRENAPVTVIQGHLDMVCEKNNNVTHDFDNDPIRMVRDRDAATGLEIIRADGTTLGADNGIGVALGLAAATLDDVKRGPLEILLTIDEEAGMSGAKALTPASITGRRLLNLDSEEDDAVYIGCAGGCDTTLEWDLPLTNISAHDEAFEIKVQGLKGGHSGCDIHEGRGSAVKLMARTLLRAGIDDLRIASIDAGSMRNAIPREAHAVVLVPANSLAQVRDAATAVTDETVVESNESDAVIAVARLGDQRCDSALSAEDSMRVLNTLAALPHGVQGMHPKVPGLVETSNNIATVKMTAENGNALIRVGNLARSSSASRLAEIITAMEAVGNLGGAVFDTANDYPGWSPDPDSELLAVCRDIYKEMFNKDPNVLAIHAGLECGVIGERVGKMDMVSFGPRIEGAHSPDERVFIESVGKTWKYLKSVLDQISRG